MSQRYCKGCRKMTEHKGSLVAVCQKCGTGQPAYDLRKGRVHR